jgi:hypothetical protein
MRNGERDKRGDTKQQTKNKQRTTRECNACKGMRVRVGDPWELDVKESRAPTMAATKAKTISYMLALAGLVFIAITAYAITAGDKDMTTQVWNTAQSILIYGLGWAMGQKRA